MTDDPKTERRETDPLFVVETNGSMPWWVRAISIYGVPAVIALFLVYSLANAATGQIADIQAKVNSHYQSMEEHRMASQSAYLEAMRLLSEIKSINRQTCINTSRNQTEANRCQ